MAPHQTQCYLASLTQIKYSDKWLSIFIPRLKLGIRYRRLAHFPVAIELVRGFGRCHEASAGEVPAQASGVATDELLFHLNRLDVRACEKGSAQCWGAPSQACPQFRVSESGIREKNTQPVRQARLRRAESHESQVE